MKTLKLRFNANQITVLTKNQIELFFKSIKFIILISTFIILSLVVNIFGFLIINSNLKLFSPNEKITYINLLVIINSIFLVIQTIYLTVSCFISQIKNNVHITELRYGYKVKNIYLSRLFFVLSVSFCSLLVMFLISSIFFAIGKSQDSYQAIYLYRLYISSFAWYASFIFLALVVTIILSRFLPESATSIIATILAFLFLFFPAISGFLGNFSSNFAGNNMDYDERDDALLLIKEDYQRKLITNMENDETLKNIYSDFDFVNQNTRISWNELVAGPKLWNLSDSENSQIENYNNFYQSIVMTLRQGPQITSWDIIPEISSVAHIKAKEPIGKVVQKIITNKASEKYNYLLNFIIKATKNYEVLKSVNVFFQYLDDYSANEKEFIKANFTSDEYYFIKTLNTLLFSIIERKSDDVTSYNSYDDWMSDIKSRIKKHRISNIFNPLYHFSLMFNGVNYHNEFLYDAFSQQQIAYGIVPNIDFTGNLNDLNQPFKLKRIVPTEAIYLFYWALGAGLIWLSYLRFNKKARK
ncbi:hypothetical protein LT335_00696 [Spiroplasma sp. JKS002669]|uniref:hypothetical protein n=1 Tax=Spiroplasma attinicola TaxID=2904537 RepID=UPI0020BD892F|nr:hypothetical protein [Spiroplasma sp. JKS002669]MCL6429134.1 hypothetical protein [Spiroplasma sp. JKS002669]